MKKKTTTPPARPAPATARFRLLLTLLLGLASLIPGSAVAAAVAATPPELRAIVRDSLAGMNRADGRRSEYSYVAVSINREFDATGAVKSQSSVKWRRDLESDGRFYGRPLERDGKPVTPEEKARREQEIQKAMADYKALSDSEKQKRQIASRKQSQEEDSWIQEFPEALDYKIIGEESVNGRPAMIVELSPRQDYRPKSMRARVFEKMRGKLWIDKTEHELARADAEVFDTVNVGFGILGRIEKGTRFFVQRRKVAAGLWLTEEQSMKFGARILLVKTMRQEMIQKYSEFVHKSELESRTRAAASN